VELVVDKVHRCTKHGRKPGQACTALREAVAVAQNAAVLLQAEVNEEHLALALLRVEVDEERLASALLWAEVDKERLVMARRWRGEESWSTARVEAEECAGLWEVVVAA
jgi:hypothetical protein